VQNDGIGCEHEAKLCMLNEMHKPKLPDYTIITSDVFRALLANLRFAELGFFATHADDVSSHWQQAAHHKSLPLLPSQ